MTASDRALEGTVIVGVDGSGRDLPAVDWATDEAASRGSNLQVLHAIRPSRWPPGQNRPPTVDADETTTAAAERAQARQPRVTVTTRVVGADPVQALLNVSVPTSVVVVGAPGRTLTRSVPRQLAARAAGPVVVVRSPPPVPDGPVVVAVDQAPVALLRFAFAHAARRGLDVRLIHAQARRPRLNFFRVERVQDADAENQAMAVEKLAAAWTAIYPDVPVDIRQVRLPAVEALTRAAADASLVVIGHPDVPTTRVRPGLAGQELLRQVPVVAVVDAPPERHNRRHQPRRIRTGTPFAQPPT